MLHKLVLTMKYVFLLTIIIIHLIYYSMEQIIKYLGFLIGAQVKAGVEMLMVYQIL